MRVMLCAVLTSLALAGVQVGARAEEGENLAKKMTLGYGMICDTESQMHRYLVLYQGRTTAEEAANTVNAETKTPGGCGMASVAFIPGDHLGNVNVSGGIMRMYKIMVFAMKTEQGWVSVPPTLQYTALFVKLDEA